MITPPDGPNGRVYLVSAARTPIGKFAGGLAGVPATELGAVAIRAAVERAGLSTDAAIDEVYMGQVLQAGGGQAPARQAALAAGLSASFLVRMPKPGAWMLWVKRALAVILLGAAEYYLVNMGRLLS